jgi:menaquinone-dependent protoporphyrinogen IX oxidase
MKIAIVYKSFLGTTQQYAGWLEKMTGGKAFRWGEITKKDIEGYDVIVISSGTYVGWMPLAGYLKKNWEVLSKKKVVVVAVGAEPAESEASKTSYEKIPSDIRKKITYFKIPGKVVSDPEGVVKKQNLDPIVEHIDKLIGKK